MSRVALALVVGLAGCGGKLEPQSGVVLDTFSFGWEYFNHRVSHVGVALDPDTAHVAIVGGTSTTSEIPELDDTCDPQSCQEFPFADDSLAELRWSVLDSETTALVPFSVDLEVGRDGASQTVSVPLPAGAKGTGAALLSGLVLDTDHELATGPACYHPSYGWHVRRFQVALGEATVDGDTATVPVTAAFAAGKSHDPDRACIDEVNEAAIVSLHVDGLLLVGRDLEVEDRDVTSSATFPFSGDKLHPEEQVPPEPEQVDVGIDAVEAGIVAMDWQFYPDATDDKGAYVRTWSWGASPDGTVGLAVTNYSPGTQLEDLSYAVTATARFVAFDGTAESRTASATLTTDLAEDGTPVVHDVAAAR